MKVFDSDNIGAGWHDNYCDVPNNQGPTHALCEQ